jgi:hypothetical protein
MTAQRPIAVASCVLCWTFGCADPFPPGVHQLHSCLRGAELSAKQGDYMSAVCSIPSDWTLIAIPAGDIQASQLVAIGVQNELAEMLVGGTERDARWCIARSIPFDPAKEAKQTTAEASCIDSDAVITEPICSRAPTVSLNIKRGPDGKLVVLELKPQ